MNSEVSIEMEYSDGVVWSQIIPSQNVPDFIANLSQTLDSKLVKVTIKFNI